MRRLIAAFVLLAVPAALLPAATSWAAENLTATFTKTSDWGSGFVANYTITNTGTSTASGWTLQFDLGSNQHITSLWNGKLAVTGNRHTVTPEDWTANIAPGSSITIGFDGTYTGAWTDPGNCTINGASCDGGSPTDDPPSAPANLSVTGVTASSVSLSWTAATDDNGVAGYRVYVDGTDTLGVASTSATVSGLAADTTYALRVTAVDTAGQQGPPSNQVSATTDPAQGDDTEPPSVPAGLTVTGTTSTSVSVSWQASTDNVGVTGYDVYVNGSLRTSPSATQATIGGLSPNTSYQVTVAAKDAAGNASGQSQPVTATTQPSSGGGADRLVGYFTQWGIYGRNFKVRDLDVSGAAALLTHINYAFGNVSSNARCFIVNQTGVGDAWADYQRGFTAGESVDGVGDVWDQELKGNFNQLKKLKAKHPHLKANISLGGWTWSKYFSDAALPQNREAFVKSCIDLYLRGDLPIQDGEPAGGAGSGFGVFDGIDLDWEWPGSPGNDGNVIRPEDKQNFTALVAEFRRQLDALEAETSREYELTAFLPADPAKIQAGIEVDPVFDLLDFATVQGYDFHGAWEPTANHQSNLFDTPGDPSPTKFSVDTAVQAYLAGGAPADKIVVGVPYYGRGWNGVPNGGTNGLFQNGTGPAPGTWEQGIEDYKVLAAKPGQRYRDTATGALWLYDGNQWWSYDDATLLTQKTGYITGNGLGGAMVWSLDGDDAQATLTKALHAGLN